MKHTWTTEEIRTSTEFFIQTFIIQKRHLSLTEAAKELHILLPNLELGSIKMHLSNSKALAEEMEIVNTANFGKLERASKAHRTIFSGLVAQLGLSAKGDTRNV